MKQKIINIIIGLFIVIVSIPMFIYGSRYISNIPIKNIHKKYSEELFVMEWENIEIHIQITSKWYFSKNFRDFNGSPTSSFKFIVEKEEIKKRIGNENFNKYGLYTIKLFNDNEMLVHTKGFENYLREVTIFEKEETVEYYYNYIQWSYSNFKYFPTMSYSMIERK